MSEFIELHLYPGNKRDIVLVRAAAILCLQPSARGAHTLVWLADRQSAIDVREGAEQIAQWCRP